MNRGKWILQGVVGVDSLLIFQICHWARDLLTDRPTRRPIRCTKTNTQQWTSFDWSDYTINSTDAQSLKTNAQRCLDLEGQGLVTVTLTTAVLNNTGKTGMILLLQCTESLWQRLTIGLNWRHVCCECSLGLSITHDSSNSVHTTHHSTISKARSNHMQIKQSD